MQEMIKTPLFLTALCLGLLCLVLLFILARQKRDVQELQQDLNKNILDFNTLLEKFDRLTQIKNQFETAAVKAQTTAEGLQVRLSEIACRTC